MMSVMPQPAHLPLHVSPQDRRRRQSTDVLLNELGNLDEALEPFAELIRQSAPSVRLYCTVPTGCPSSDICADLHDLHDLRSRSLVFVHNLVESLRASGVPASYHLQPSNSPLCLVCALPPGLDPTKIKAAAIAALQDTKLNLKEKALLADLEGGLALVIT
ncbi:hypothetical protein A0H81_01121 [Grifola frondosa]|uniref:Uncharacterized protein n=1 Tax=Grifola frondosa TaxID=5627 RepID=A0A1C7MQ56_GRIFR|nr:hypothetical protein A0H81_01121 [Grifola frondosa]